MLGTILKTDVTTNRIALNNILKKMVRNEMKDTSA